MAEDDGEDAGPVESFVSVIRRSDGSVFVDHDGDEDVALALMMRAIFTLCDPNSEVE